MGRTEAGVDSRVVLHHGLGQVTTAAWVVVTVAVVAAAPPQDRPVQASWMLAVAAALFAVGWCPALVIDDDGLTVVNPLRSNRIPWPCVEEVSVGWLLLVTASGRHFRSLAVPGPRRMGALWERHATAGGVLERDGLPRLQAAAARGEGTIGLGDASILVAQRRAARSALTSPGPVVGSWSWPGVAASVVAVVLGVVAVVLAG